LPPADVLYERPASVSLPPHQLDVPVPGRPMSTASLDYRPMQAAAAATMMDVDMVDAGIPTPEPSHTLQPQPPVSETFFHDVD